MKSRRELALGFTVVELLVVIAVIAILLAILLPAVVTVRRRANSVLCLSRLHGIGQAMLMYTTENHGWLPGSPSTSGKHLWRLTAEGEYESGGVTVETLPPGPIELFDYIGPLYPIVSGMPPSSSSGVERLRDYRQLQAFTCPSNDLTAHRSAGAAIEDGPMLSYTTAAAFMLLPARMPTDDVNATLSNLVTMPTGGSKTDPSRFQYWTSPPTYQPRLGSIGEPSRKIFLADAAKDSLDGRWPQFEYCVEATRQQSLFTDFGPFFGACHSHDRRAASEPSCPADGRIYSYRHGTLRAHQSNGSYKMNVVFFDGHTATLDDVESARPDYWLPTGSMIYRNVKLNATEMVFWPDAWDRFLPHVTQTSPYRVP